MAVMVGGTGNFSEAILPGGGNLRSDFDYSNLFWKLKAAFCEYWASAKIKISMTFVFKEYEFKIKKAHVQWIQLKMKFLVGYNLEIVI